VITSAYNDFKISIPDYTLRDISQYQQIALPPSIGIDIRTLSITGPSKDIPKVTSAFTLVFNESINAFSSFYSHTPKHYIMDGKRVISQGTDTGIFIHDEGVRSKFYNVQKTSSISLIVNPKGTHTKTFNNFEFLSQVEDVNGVDIFNETISSIRVYNEYQDSGIITLTPETNIKRLMRTWRLTTPRDNSARIRNPYIQIDIVFDNATTTDRRITLHDFITYYFDAPM